MARIFEFSDGFDAAAFHFERMSRPDYDDYYEEETDPDPISRQCFLIEE